jgi:RND family efflux transporter MFP subunit
LKLVVARPSANLAHPFKHFMKRSLASLCLCLAALAEDPKPAAPPAAGAAVTVTVTAAELVPLDRTLPVVGTLFARDEALLAAEVEGVVQKTAAEFGDRVQDGQEIALIATDTYAALANQAAARLEQLRATAANADHELARQLQLQSSGIASPADLDNAKNAADNARAAVAAADAARLVAELDLAHSHVRAPFDGAVAERIATRGDFMQKGKPMFRLVNDATLKFIVQAPESYAADVQKELPVEFSVDAFPGEKFTGKVYLISPQVNAATRAFAFGALVPNEGRRLKAGTFARGELIIRRGVPAVMIPLESAVALSGVTRVFVVEGGVAKSRPVKLGRVKDGRQEVLSGLKGGELVVTSGQTKLSDGKAVVLREAAKTAGVTAAVK